VAARDKCDAISLPDQTHQTSQQLSAAAAGVAADVEVVVPVAAAGGRRQVGRLRHLLRWRTRFGAASERQCAL